ncbi:MAG: tetratricopeptide repeat protein [Planctomycetaceae bacterium]
MFDLKSNPNGRFPECDYLTTTGERIRVRLANPARLFKWIDRIYFTLGVVALGCCWVPFVIANHRGPFGSLLWLIGSGLGLLWCGRHRRLSTTDILNDTRPPALYLRSFADDQSRFKSLFQENDELGEVDLVSALGRGGPVLAIGRPGEPLPPEGALRIYVDDAHWQAVVADLARRSRVVVLRAGESDGLQWELQKVGETVDPSRLILFLPFNANSIAERYARFRAWAQNCLPGSLPDQLTDTTLLYFHSDWRAVPLILGQSKFVDLGADAGAVETSSRSEFLIVPCLGCGANVHPTADGDCPSCRVKLPTALLNGNGVEHPIQEDLARLASDVDFFSKAKVTATRSTGWRAWLSRPIPMPFSISCRGKLRTALKAFNRATFRLRAVVSNALVFVVLVGLLAMTTFWGPPKPSGKFGRAMWQFNKTASREAERRADEEKKRAQDAATRIGKLKDNDLGFRMRMDAARSEAQQRLQPELDLMFSESLLQMEITKQPDNPKLRCQLARLLIRKKKFDEAEEQLLKANSPEINEDALLELARLYEQTGRIADAKTRLELLLYSNPKTHREAAQSALDRLSKLPAK